MIYQFWVSSQNSVDIYSLSHSHHWTYHNNNNNNNNNNKGKGKGKVRPRTGHEGPEEEQMYSSTLSLTSALDGGGWSMPRPGHFPHRERPGTHCIGGWVGRRAGLEGCWNFHPTGIRSPDRSVRSESLYRLHYPGPYNNSSSNNNNNNNNNNKWRRMSIMKHCMTNFFLVSHLFLPPQVNILCSPSITEKNEVPQPNKTTRTVTPFVSIIHKTFCSFQYFLTKHLPN